MRNYYLYIFNNAYLHGYLINITSLIYTNIIKQKKFVFLFVMNKLKKKKNDKFKKLFQ